MIIDFHTHCFPDKLFGTAIKKLSFAAGIMPEADGSKDGLLKSMEENKVDVSVVLSVATNGKQQKNVNDFAESLKCKEIIPFGSVYPNAPDALCELERIKSLGMKGVKFHPEYQNFYIDDDKMVKIYKKISSLDLITVFHSGADYGYPPPYHTDVRRIKKALSHFDSPVVLAHWGGLDMRCEVLKELCGENVYFDVSYGYGNISKYYAQKIIEKHGTDKILFGSDSPWHKPAWERFLLETLELSDEDKEKIYHKNAEKLLNLTEEV